MIAVRDRVRTLQASALCLGYPDGTLLGYVPLLARTAAARPTGAAAPPGRLVGHTAGTDPREREGRAAGRQTVGERVQEKATDVSLRLGPGNC